MWVNQVHPIEPIIFDLAEGTTMRHESLSGHVCGWVDLEEQEIAFALQQHAFEGIDIVFCFRLAFGYSDQLDLIRDHDVALVSIL